MSFKPEFLQQCSSIKEPESFYSGISCHRTGMRGNILSFFRTANSLKYSGLQSHYRYMLIVGLNGSGFTCIGGKRHFEVKAGEAYLMEPFQQHYHHDFSEDCQWLFITFEAKEKKYASLGLRKFQLTEIFKEELGRFVDDYCRLDRKGVEERLVLRLQLMLNLLSSSEKQITESVVKENLPVICRRVIDYILENIDQPIHVDDLASHFGFSSGHLRKIFRENALSSLGRTIRFLRFSHAEHLLGSSTMSISEIVSACGFESISTFSRNFKKNTGLTPKDFRRKMQDLEN